MYFTRRETIVWASMAVTPRLTPGLRPPLNVPSSEPPSTAAGYSLPLPTPLRLMSEMFAHCTSDVEALSPELVLRGLGLLLHACIGSLTSKRPSRPISQVGLVASRA